MFPSCISDGLCDVDDVMLLEEITREITGRGATTTPLTTTTTMRSKEVSVRLRDVKGVFHNRLSGGESSQQEHHQRLGSLLGVRLVAAILKDEEIITVSTPSEPLLLYNRRINEGCAFEARWKGSGSIMSFDHSISMEQQEQDSNCCYQLVLALVNSNQTTDNFLLACPCAEAMLQLSPRQEPQGVRREVALVSRPSPRNFVLFPCFRGNHNSAGTRNSISKTSIRDNMEEKKTESSRGNSQVELELPYLSLEKATMGIEVSWQEKEMDVEVCFAGQDVVHLSSNLPGQPQPAIVQPLPQILMDTTSTPRGYSLQRFPKDQYSGSFDGVNDRGDEESFINVRVREELDSMARQQLSPTVIYQPAGQQNGQMCSQSTGSDSLLEDVMRALNIEFQEANQQEVVARPNASTSPTQPDLSSS